MSRISSFFRSVNPYVIAPSQVAADIWRRCAGYDHKEVIVQPHVSIDWRPLGVPSAVDEKDPIRIAFAGAPVYYKGWDAFANLVRLRRYECHYFGMGEAPCDVTSHSVSVTHENREAMVQAIQEAKIDLLIHFAPWPETFSFTAVEALAAGAYLVTNQNAGNVAALVELTGRGVVLKSMDDLLSWVGRAECRSLVNRARSDRSRFVPVVGYSNMSIEVIHNEERP